MKGSRPRGAVNSKGGKEREGFLPAGREVSAIWMCLACEEAMEEGSDTESIECGRCKLWCHKKCSGLSDKNFRLLQTSGEEILWSCKGCRDSERGAENDTSRSRLEAKMDRMMDMLMAVTNRLTKLESVNGGMKESDLGEKVEQKVNEAMEEMIEREKRKLNVIFVNVPESESELAEERQKGDMQKIVGLVGKISDMDITKNDMINPVRLGAKMIGRTSKPRMLRITVRSEEVKKKLMQNAHKLRDSEKGNRVFINPDRTPKERENFRKLREELEKRRKDDPDLVIKGGRIVRGKGGEAYGRGDQSRKGEGQNQDDKKGSSNSDRNDS